MVAIVDKSILSSDITSAESNRDSVIVSADGSDVLTTVEWVTTADVSTYQTAINIAQAVLDDVTANQATVDTAVTDLGTATTNFNTAKDYGTLDLSDFTPSLVDPGDKTEGLTFGINLSGAVDVNGDNLSGDINVTVYSDVEAQNILNNQPITFTAGSASFPMDLFGAGLHTLTITVDGVTNTETLAVNVIASLASITPNTATFDNKDASATITVTDLIDAEGVDTLAHFISDDGSIYAFMMNDDATTLVDVTVTKAAASADLLISTPSQATSAGAYSLFINRPDGNMWEIDVTVTDL